MKRQSILASVPIIVASTIIGVAAAEGRDPAPACAKFHYKETGKGKFVVVNLRLTNATEAPLWFALPWLCDKPPRLSGPVYMPQGFKPDYISAEGWTHRRHSGRVITLTVLCVTNDNNFKLIRMPARGTVEFASYRFEMLHAEYRSSFRLSTANRILVNDKEPLETWLPYETLSDPNGYVPAGLRQDNLNFDLKVLGTRRDFRTEPITHLNLNVTGTWEISIDGFK